MTLVEQVLSSVVGAALAVLLPPLYDGVHRKIRARIHCRRGPPVLQTWYDILKLMIKEDVVPKRASALFFTAPYVSLGYLVVAAVMMPMIYLVTALNFTFDLVLLLYLLSSASVFLVLGGMCSGNVFSFEGGRRELMLAIMTEAAVIVSLISIAVRYGTFRIFDIYSKLSSGFPAVSTIIAAVILIMCAYIEGFRLPFELPEAEPEIAGGTTIEYSGRRLAMFKLSVLVKQFLLVALAVNVLEPWTMLNPILGIPSFVVKTLAIYVVFALSEPLFGRYRIEEALKALILPYSLSALSLTLAILGV